MSVDSFRILGGEHQQLCKTMFDVLSCNLMWIMQLENGVLKMLVTDRSILQHYWENKYYLSDPNISTQANNTDSLWKVNLGTDCAAFIKSGFFYDLYKMFHVAEFVSIEKNIGAAHYCFRFFTRNDRFIFMNKLLNDLPIIKYCMDVMLEKIKIDLHMQPGVNVVEL
jgi:hypothetical protein